jgi:hypothetical protein
MNIDAVLESLVQYGEDDWIPLWVIAQDAEELLDTEDQNEILEVTVTLVKELLKRGFRAGESPHLSAVDFVAWPDQDPEAVAFLIRREWMHRGTLPGWGDCPWLCGRHLGRAGQCLS